MLQVLSKNTCKPAKVLILFTRFIKDMYHHLVILYVPKMLYKFQFLKKLNNE